MNKLRLLVDLDGVFHQHAADLFGYRMPDKQGYDIVTDICEAKGITEDSFWSKLNWATIPLMPDALEILRICENVVIMTKSSRDPESASGKVAWIQTFLPKRYHRMYLIGPPKWIAAARNTVLIAQSLLLRAGMASCCLGRGTVPS